MSYWLLVPLSGLVSLFALALMLHFGGAGPLDTPNHRSLHSTPVPRGGGVGILIGLAPGLFWSSPWVLTGLTLVAIVSWWDDKHSLPVATRFASHFAAAALVVLGMPSNWGLSAGALALLAIVWMTNLYNFMDGANGLAGGMAVFGFGALAAAAAMAGQTSMAIQTACIAAAAAGFLVFNFDPARIFMGDVGSVPLGFLAAALGLEGVRLDIWPLWFPVLAFAPFIADASVTLAKRALRGEKVWLAHREHYYQRLVRSGWSHRKLALYAYALMAALSVSACVALGWSPLAQGVAVAGWTVVLGGLMLKIDSLKVVE